MLMKISFNPTMVRLQRWWRGIQRVAGHQGFNPTMVRLQLGEGREIGGSHGKVSIPLWCDCNKMSNETLSAPSPGFNPTMVRLQLTSLSSTVKSKATVSIPLWCDCNVYGNTKHDKKHACFNPTMVRLQLSMIRRGYVIFLWFQSHYGAIATPPITRANPASPSFNPTMVRLQR